MIHMHYVLHLKSRCVRMGDVPCGGSLVLSSFAKYSIVCVYVCEYGVLIAIVKSNSKKVNRKQCCGLQSCRYSHLARLFSDVFLVGGCLWRDRKL